jgi:ribonuclease J
MWKEYINPASKHAKQEYLSLLEKFSNLETVHTSGHASADCLAEVCNLINPSVGIIPIHSEHSEEYRNLAITDELKSKIITSSETKGNIEIQIR